MTEISNLPLVEFTAIAGSRISERPYTPYIITQEPSLVQMIIQDLVEIVSTPGPVRTKSTLTSSRFGDVWDWVADGIGVFVGIAIYITLIKVKS